MRFPISVGLLACLACSSHGTILAQGDWEFLGPGVGYRPEAFFVSQNAIYLGLAEEDLTTGLGLYWYRFDEGQWEPFAWQGYRILGITVWGESDENILLIRFGPGWHSDVLRSTNGGETWNVTLELDDPFSGITQAPSDTSRVLIHFPAVLYSMDGGWTWDVAGGSPWNGSYDVSFDSSNSLVVYLTGVSEIGLHTIYKSTDGGANWYWSHICGAGSWGIDVDHDQPNHVMSGSGQSQIYLTTNAGENWTTRPSPFRTKMIHSPPWSPGNFYSAGSDLDETTYQVRRTEDLGETWFPCGGNLPVMPGTDLWSTQMYLEGHPTQSVLYAALEGSGVWRWDVATSGAPDAVEGPAHEPRLLAYPVPSSDRLTYGMRLAKPEHVALLLFDPQGRLVETLREGFFPAGTYTFNWGQAEGMEHHIGSGVYYLRLDAGEMQETRKVVLLK